MSKFEESNFYKALQDFFINADKKTFLQFLAEFYNRTEGIIDKNNIQDDLIKELRELYLEFNEKGIDENIIREKVNYFLENSVKIKDVISKLNTNTNNIKNINSQLDTIKNNHLYLNIKDFGATGEESQDVTEILKTMLNSINTNSATIKFPLGTYNITSEITLPKKTLTFIGDGVEGTIIKNSTGNTIRSFFFKDNKNNNRFNCFKDIQFNCNKKVNRAIYFERGNGTKITNCRFINHLEAGI